VKCGRPGTNLDLDVALKVLPPSASDGPARKERFFREAKAASALNHPNIITIHEINSEAVSISSRWNWWAAARCRR